MRRDAHPPHARPQALSAPAPAAALALVALALALATGALRSPFLLILPFPAALLMLAVSRTDARWVLGFGTAALLAGQAVSGGLGLATTTAALLAAGALHLSTEWLRRRVRIGGRPAETPTEAAPAGIATDRTRELQALLEATRAWTGAVAMIAWQVRDGAARPIAAAGRIAPAPRQLEGDPLGWVAREGTPLWLEPTPYWSEPGFSVAAARVHASGAAAWLVTTEFGESQGRPAHDDLDAALGAVRLFIGVLPALEQADAEHVHLQRLLALLRRIPVAVEPAAFGRELLDAAVVLTGASGGTLASWTLDEGEVLVTIGDDGGPAPGDRFAPPASELALAVRAGGLIERTGGSWRPGATHVATERDRWTARPRTLICVPLDTPSGTVGVLGLWSRHANRLDPASLELLRAVLPYAALHLDHAQEFGRLRERAERDALTGLRNRRAFETAFLAERLRLERYGHPLALLMIDIDHFKSINDQHGHEAGDDVLRTTAAIIRGAIRDVDIPARFGGEEFVVLLPETGRTAAADVAERVRAAVAAAGIEAGGARIAVHVSVGVSACPESVAAPADLVGSADAALYEAKRGGRDRVVVAAPLQAGRAGPSAPRPPQARTPDDPRLPSR